MKVISRSTLRHVIPALSLAAMLGLMACGTPAKPVASVDNLAILAANAQAIAVGFNGPDNQFPYMDQFYAAQTAYYKSIGATAPAGTRCHAYLSWDIANQAVGSGPLGTEGSRAWFEDWLSNAQGHCTEALISFKTISGVSSITTPPTNTAYEAAITAFLAASWTYTGFTGTFVYTAWNEPNGAGAAGNGLSAQLTPQQAADYYLIFRKHCTTGCSVAAGDFYSNGQGYLDFYQNCADDTQTPCSNASYMDSYKYYLVTDAVTFGLGTGTSFRPEIFSYHDWDDLNNYQNVAFPQNECTGDLRCTTRAILGALTQDTWAKVQIWDTEVAAGQNPQSNPTPTIQACTVSYLYRISAGISTRITRIYYTQPFEADGLYWSLYDATGAQKPAFAVLATHNTAYQTPSGAICP